jgi:serine/threonine-protein kinase RsbW
MPMRKEIKLKNDFSEIKKLNNFLSQSIRRYFQNISNYQAIQLSLEEIFNNILLYAYPDNQRHEIHFTFIMDKEVIQIFIEDNGIPFNPLDIDKPKMTSTLRERQVGGLGIHLVRSLMDQVSYQRNEDKNILYMKKNLNG